MRQICLTCLFTLLASTVAAAELRVVATLPELAELTRLLGGERVEVHAIARGDQDPHALNAKPSHSRRMMKADLLVANGLELEVGWLPLLIQGARNPELQEGNIGHLDLSAAVAPLEIPTGGVDRSQGDVHPEGNPHYTVDPGLYPALADRLAARLIELDPAGSQQYRMALDRFRTDWTGRLADWSRRLVPLRGLRVIAYHKQWEYLAHRYGLEIVDYVEDRPGIPPSPRHVAELTRRIREEKIPLLIYSDLVHPDTPEKLASRAGCQSLKLPQAPGSRKGTEGLAEWFEVLMTALEAAGAKGGS
jgi:zinc/manganese transport system substrate-binding protein